MNGALATALVGGLPGRARERAAIERLLAQARRGEGAALVIRGEAGIGKTALLDLTLGESGAMTVLQVTGVEAAATSTWPPAFAPPWDCSSSRSDGRRRPQPRCLRSPPPTAAT